MTVAPMAASTRVVVLSPCLWFSTSRNRARSACLAERIIACPSRPALFGLVVVVVISIERHTQRVANKTAVRLPIVEFSTTVLFASRILIFRFCGNCLSCRAERLKHVTHTFCEMSPLRKRGRRRRHKRVIHHVESVRKRRGKKNKIKTVRRPTCVSQQLKEFTRRRLRRRPPPRIIYYQRLAQLWFRFTHIAILYIYMYTV